MDGYSEFDLTDGGRTIEQYEKMLSDKDAQKVGFVLDKMSFEHDQHHFVRLRPFCPSCRGGRIFAYLSLASWLMTHPGRLPADESDTTLDWDTAQVEELQATDQSVLYMTRQQLAEMQPPHDLIEGLIPAKGVGYITGRDRSLKTFLALDVCLHVAFMLPFWHHAGPFGSKVPRRRVGFNGEGKILFAAGEGVSSFNPRIDAWIQAQHVKSYSDPMIKTADGEYAIRHADCKKCSAEEDDFVGHVGHLEFAHAEDLDDTTMVLVPGAGELEDRNVVVRRGAPNMFKGADDYRYMLAHARREKPDIIVIDTLALASGGADQQSNSEMGEVHARAAELAQASDGVVLLIAHTDKGDNDARGASVIEDNADFVLHCNRVDNDQVEVTVAKRKDAEDNWRFSLGVTVVDIGFDQSSLILHDFDGVVPSSTPEEDKIESELSQAAVRIVIGKKVNEFDAYEFAREINQGRTTVTKHLERMVISGDLRKSGGGRGAGNKNRYHLSEDWLKHINDMGYGDIEEWTG